MIHDGNIAFAVPLSDNMANRAIRSDIFRRRSFQVKSRLTTNVLF
jgi:hypothetical protein